MDNNVSLLSYTSKDYERIYEELREAVPLVSQLWNTDSEADPGNVLIKLISMLGDMLSYNFDLQVLELFPDSVTQRKNVRQVFSLMGYKTHWYRSARCNITLVNQSSMPGIVPIYSRFSDKNQTITYTNIRQYDLSTSPDVHNVIDLVQGIPVTPTKLRANAVSKYDINWHDVYDYNVDVSNIVNNRIWFSRKNVEESTIRLIDNYGTEWTQVESLETQDTTGKLYEFKVNEDDEPYIELCDYWQGYNCTKFKIFYIISLGEAGQISENALTEINSSIVSPSYNSENNTLSTIRINDQIDIYGNSASSLGYYPEEADEARHTSANYINTFDTLITLDDFAKAIKRLDGVANCMATDYMTDPTLMLADEYVDGEGHVVIANTDPNKYTIKLYIVRSPDYEEVDPDSFKAAMIASIYNKQMIPLNVIVDLNNIQRFTWTVKGTIYLTETVNVDKANQILLKINDALTYKYNINKSEFNETVRYIDVINTIMEADQLIKYVDIDNIKYMDVFGDYQEESEITGKNIVTIPYESHTNRVFTITGLKTPINPGSIRIRCVNGITIMDNKFGKLMCNSDVFLRTGSVSYFDGTITFELYDVENMVHDDLELTYYQNKVSMVEYHEFNVSELRINSDNVVSNY